MLRQLHEKYHVSLDWLLAGTGEMLLEHGDHDKEPKVGYSVTLDDNARAQRLCLFIQKFMASASQQEQIQFEMQLRLSIPQYKEFLEDFYDE